MACDRRKKRLVEAYVCARVRISPLASVHTCPKEQKKHACLHIAIQWVLFPKTNFHVTSNPPAELQPALTPSPPRVTQAHIQHGIPRRARARAQICQTWNRNSDKFVRTHDIHDIGSYRHAPLGAVNQVGKGEVVRCGWVGQSTKYRLPFCFG